MSTYVGDNTFRTVSESESHEAMSFDSLRITRRGSHALLSAEKALWPKGITGTSLGYPYMTLRSKRVDSGGSNFSNIELYFEGFLTTETGRGFIDNSDDISLQSGSFPVSGSDDVTVQAKYMAQTNTTRWVHRGTRIPTSPRFPITLASDINTVVLFDHYPARYPGSVLSKPVGRLMQFTRTELAPNVWGVVETWMNRIEADE
jgi:hypothetical protein